MIDIIPAAALASLAVSTKKEKEPSQNNETPEVDNDSGEKLPEEQPQEAGPKKKSTFFVISIVILALVIVVSIILLLFNLKNLEKYFSDSAFDNETTNEAFKHLDEDGDGLTTLEEMAQGTMVFDPDTDKDGLPDGYEVKNGLNALNYNDGTADLDDDKLSNVDEYTYKTDINDPDTDKDGYLDGEEVIDGFNPAGKGELQKKPKTNDKIEEEKETVISITNERFSPSVIRINKGETIIFENKDNISHSISSQEIESGTIEPGGSYSFTFFIIGTYEYYDISNEDLVGKIEVR